MERGDLAPLWVHGTTWPTTDETWQCVRSGVPADGEVNAARGGSKLPRISDRSGRARPDLLFNDLSLAHEEA